MRRSRLVRFLAVLPITLFAAAGIALEKGGGKAGWVPEAKCINRICVTGYPANFICWDDDEDGWCDRTEIKPIPPGG